MEGFSLAPHQVPDPPANTDWADHLRWAIMVADPGTSDFKWSVFLLKAYLDAGRLSLKQGDVGNEILARLRDRFDDRELWCQAGNRPDPNQGRLRLVHSDEAAS